MLLILTSKRSASSTCRRILIRFIFQFSYFLRCCLLNRYLFVPSLRGYSSDCSSRWYTYPAATRTVMTLPCLTPCWDVYSLWPTTLYLLLSPTRLWAIKPFYSQSRPTSCIVAVEHCRTGADLVVGCGRMSPAVACTYSASNNKQ